MSKRRVALGPTERNSPTVSALAWDTSRRRVYAYLALGPTRGPRPEALCRKMQRAASATAELLHRPRLLATENCSVGDSRTVAPAAVCGVVYDAALGPTRPSARLGATRATVELLHRSRMYGKMQRRQQ